MDISKEVKDLCDRTGPLNEAVADLEAETESRLGRELTDKEHDRCFRQVYEAAGFAFDADGKLKEP